MTAIANLPLDWHREPRRHVIKAARQNTMPHAWLLQGPKGVGKYAFAKQMTAWLLCESEAKTENEMPCDQCRSCRWLQAGTHPNVIEVSAEANKRFIGVDAIRSVITFLQQTTAVAGYKIVLIRLAEWMNAAASNALLKTLEEPAGNTIFFLINEHPSFLAPTLRSRCQLLKLFCAKREDALAWLQQRFPDHSVDVCARALGQAEQAPLLAAEWLESGRLSKREASFKHWEACIVEGKLSPSVTVSEALKQDDVLELLEDLALWLSDRLRTATLPNPRAAYDAWDQILEYRRQLLIEKVPLNETLLLENVLCILSTSV